MQASTAQLAWIDDSRYLGPADVLTVDRAENRVQLRLADSSVDVGAWARVAIPADCELCAGDQVLVIGESPSELYVIGLLRPTRRAAASSKSLSLIGGAYTTAAGPRDDQVLRVFSGRDELIFEYDEARHRARVNVDCGDLQFIATRGNIEFTSGRDVVIQGRSVGISSTSAVQLTTRDDSGTVQAAISVQERRIELSGPHVCVSAERGDVRMEDASFAGRRAVVRYRQAKVVAERIETLADTFIERAKNVYRTVERLSQLKAGRLRTLVDSTFHLKARRAIVTSDEDCKITAAQIHLG